MRLLQTLAVTMLLAGTALADQKGWEYFQTNFDEAQKLAQSRDKPLYLHFTTTWCGWCRKLEAEVYSEPEGKKLLEDFVAVTLDCTVPQGQQPSPEVARNLALMRKYGGRGYPYLVITQPDGELLHTFSGYRPLPLFAEGIARAEKVRTFLNYAKTTDKSSYEYNQRGMSLYAELEEYAKAAQFATALNKLDPEGAKGDQAQIAFVLLAGALARNTGEDKIASLFQAVEKADPKNAGGYLERAYMARMMHAFAAGQDPTKRKEALAEALKHVTALTKNVQVLKDPVDVYHAMGILKANLGDPAGAIEALDKALAANPPEEQAKGIREAIAQLKQIQD